MNTKGFLRHRTQHGFTLIELLVVVAIISLLVSILLPSLKKAKDLAKAAVCRTHGRGTAMTLMMYSSEHLGGDLLTANVYKKLSDGSYQLYTTWYDLLLDNQYIDDVNAMRCPSLDSRAAKNDYNNKYIFGYRRSYSASSIVEDREPYSIKKYSASSFPILADSVQIAYTTTPYNQYYTLGNYCGAVHLRHLDFTANIMFVDGHSEVMNYVQLFDRFDPYGNRHFMFFGRWARELGNELVRLDE